MSFFILEMSKDVRPKYHVRKPTGVLKYKCPKCNGFDLLERTGEVHLWHDAGFVQYEIIGGRWFSCFDCEEAVRFHEVKKVNRKNFTEEDKQAYGQACLNQSTSAKIQAHLKKIVGSECDSDARCIDHWGLYFEKSELQAITGEK